MLRRVCVSDNEQTMRKTNKAASGDKEDSSGCSRGLRLYSGSVDIKLSGVAANSGYYAEPTQNNKRCCVC